MKILPIIALACFAAVPGCLIDRAVNGDGIQVQQPNDIPVPQGMKLMDRLNESHTVVNGGYRFENLIYEGLVPPLEVAAFLAERMPQHAFREESREDKGPDHKVLVFKRGSYTAECTVRRMEYTTQLAVQVRTHIHAP